MKAPKKLDPISIRLDQPLKEALEDLAKTDERPLSQYVTRVLRQHVADQKPRKRA